MKKTWFLMSIALMVGMVAMYVGTNFRLEIRPTNPSQPPIPASTYPSVAQSTATEPQLLPRNLLSSQTPFAGDREVVPASFQLSTVVAPAVIGQEPAKKSKSIKNVTDTDTVGIAKLKYNAPFSRTIPITGKHVKLTLNEAVKEKEAQIQVYQIDPTGKTPIQSASKPITAGDNVEITVPDANKIYSLELQIVGKVKPDANAKNPPELENVFPALTADIISIATPTESALPGYSVQSLKRNRYSSSPNVIEGFPSQKTEADALMVYNRYLEVRLQIPAGFVPEFEVLSVTNGEAEYQPTFSVSSQLLPSDRQQSFSTYQLTLPDTVANQICLLLIRARNGSQHVYAAPSPLIYKQISRAFDQLPIPLITDNGVSPGTVDASASPKKQFRTNKRVVTLTGTFDKAPDLTSDAYVLTVNDKLSEASSVKIAVSGGTATWSATAQLPTDGIYEFQMRPAVGGSVSEQPTLRFTVLVNTQGPRVQSIYPIDFVETPTKLSELEIVFSPSTPLDPSKFATATLAKALFTTELVSPSGVTKPEVKEARFVPPNRVVIAFDNPVPLGTFKLSIGAGLADLFGNGLQESEGIAATSFTREFRRTEGTGPRSILDDAPSESRTVSGIPSTLQPAPLIAFRPYVVVDDPTEGFNPSDRVETRVALLYYYRDAHRVAQIINRSLKSYNAATVETRRRSADRIRDDANKATDERRRLESAAVQASRKSRIAEAELGAAQADIGNLRSQELDARAKRDEVRSQLQVARAQLVEFQRNKIGQATLNEADLRELRLSQLKATTPDTTTAPPATQTQSQTTTQPTTANQPVTQTTQTQTTTPTISQADLDRDREQARVERFIEAERNKRDQLVGAQEVNLRLQITKLEQDLATLEENVARTENGSRTVAQRINNAAGKVQQFREEEARATEAARAKGEEENRLREEQFRREVAAAKEDPDSYAPGNPDSIDPVLRCSVSVIGEGKIHLRGPLKGLNIIRTMINQIDSPVGQVRIGVHSIQVNGERGDRMERVVGEIGDYIDHARFMTLTSTNLLRRAITQVAARKAEEAIVANPDRTTQVDRDQMYIDAFFGSQFLQELRTLDSEFLQSGNKILSLHSMDNTSLAGGMFIWALAKNSIRLEILQEFQALMQDYLPNAEINFLTEGHGTMCKHGKKCKNCEHCGHLMSNNSRFQSLLAFFESQVGGADTITPIQREFIRLAQIFKARLITEKELKQRVFERSLVEERIQNNYRGELQKARDHEQKARDAADAATEKLIAVRAEVTEAVTSSISILRGIRASLGEIRDLSENIAKIDVNTFRPASSDPMERLLQKEISGRNRSWKIEAIPIDMSLETHLFRLSANESLEFKRLVGLLEDFVYGPETLANFLNAVAYYKKFDPAFGGVGLTKMELRELVQICKFILREVEPILGTAETQILKLYQQVSQQEGFGPEAYTLFTQINTIARRQLTGETLTQARKFLDKAEGAFQVYFTRRSEVLAKTQIARAARHPLDYKKLLDLFVDDVEEKYIEQLEGTRAHIANIDNYIKALITALDDDLNRQFYLPAFRCIRQASRTWDVTLGQIETTTILTNNRAFGKVDPSATMEFDLPKRDPLIVEAMAGAKALIDQYGALVNDPSFLSLVKLRSGQPTSSPVQGNLFNGSAVRNILPGLASTTDEQILAQGGAGRREFQSPLEALIPDPAIYKFETGTGYEIRPVVSPDGQNVVFNFNYLYTTNIREPVRADEKHLGRVKRHYVHTDVQLSNFELREVSRYLVALKVSRTGRGVQLLQDIPGLGVLFRPLPSAESSLQQNIILSQATIFPTLFELMGLRWAPSVADIDPLSERNRKWVIENREKFLLYRTLDESSSFVDDALRVPYGIRRTDLNHVQESIPLEHPNGFKGMGRGEYDSRLQEGDIFKLFPERQFAPRNSRAGSPLSPDYPADELNNNPFRAKSDYGQIEISPQEGFFDQPTMGSNPPKLPSPTGPVLAQPVSRSTPPKSGSTIPVLPTPALANPQSGSVPSLKNNR